MAKSERRIDRKNKGKHQSARTKRPWLVGGGVFGLAVLVVCLAVWTPQRAPRAPLQNDESPIVSAPQNQVESRLDSIRGAIARASQAYKARNYRATLIIINPLVTELEVRLQKTKPGSPEEVQLRKLHHDAQSYQAFCTAGVDGDAQALFNKHLSLYRRTMPPLELAVVLGQQGRNLIKTGPKQPPQETKMLYEAIQILKEAQAALGKVNDPPADVKAEIEQTIASAQATVLLHEALKLMEAGPLDLDHVIERREVLGKAIKILASAKEEADKIKDIGQELKLSIKTNTAHAYASYVVDGTRFLLAAELRLKAAQDELELTKDAVSRSAVEEAQQEVDFILAQAKVAEGVYKELLDQFRDDPSLGHTYPEVLKNVLRSMANLLEQEPGRQDESTALRTQADQIKETSPPL